MQDPIRQDFDQGSASKKQRLAGYSNPETDAMHAAYVASGMYALPGSTPSVEPLQTAQSLSSSAVMDDYSTSSTSLINSTATYLDYLDPHSAPAPSMTLPEEVEFAEPFLASRTPSGFPTPGNVTPRTAGKSKAVDSKRSRANSVPKDSGDEDGPPPSEERKAGKQAEKQKDVESGWIQESRVPGNQFQILSSILSRLKSARDSSTGRLLCETLLRPPSAAFAPSFYQVLHDPLTLEVVESRLMSSQYRSAEAFDKDLNQIFANAKRWIDPVKQELIYGDVLTLQRIYHDATKGDGTQSDGRSDESKSASRERTPLESIHFKGQNLQVGDWVHVFNPSKPAKCTIGQIWKIFRKKEWEICLTCDYPSADSAAWPTVLINGV